MHRPARWLKVECVAAMLLARPACADVGEHWYVLEMEGHRCGHMRALTTKEGDRFATRAEMKLTIKRGDATVPVEMMTEFVETAEGKPVRMKAETKLGTMPSVDEYIFKADSVQVTHSVAGSRRTESKPLPRGEWMTPERMDRYIAEQIAAGSKEISVRMIEPSAGLDPTTTTMKLVEKTTVEVFGKTAPAIRWITHSDLVPGADATEYTDEKGLSLRHEMDIGGIKVVFLAADRALAMSKADPPELMESTFIRPDKQIGHARMLKSAEYLVRADGPIAEWPSVGAQSVKRVDEKSLRVNEVASARTPALKAELDAKEFTSPSSMINSDDVEVMKLTDRALAGKGDMAASAKAEEIRRFVCGFISKKNFDVGFASAAEVARTHCGDCTEHAVLCCAMCRVAGIPARCVSGLVYVDGLGKNGEGAFGYHLWTQAMLEVDGVKSWVDLDPTLSSDRAMDASHIAIQTLGLADGQTMNALMDILPTLRKLKISVEKSE